MRSVPFAGTRGFVVSAGTTTFRLICQNRWRSKCLRLESNRHMGSPGVLAGLQPAQHDLQLIDGVLMCFPRRC